jgi:undecaprenyl-diphosphatase
MNKNSKEYYYLVYFLSEILIYVVTITPLIFIMLTTPDKFILTVAPVFTAIGISEMLKYFIRTERPKKHFLEKKYDTSFPSSHSAGAFSISTFLTLNLQNPLGLIFLIMAVFVAVGRVLSGAHYKKDVISGAILGIIVALGFYYLEVQVIFKL